MLPTIWPKSFGPVYVCALSRGSGMIHACTVTESDTWRSGYGPVAKSGCERGGGTSRESEDAEATLTCGPKAVPYAAEFALKRSEESIRPCAEQRTAECPSTVQKKMNAALALRNIVLESSNSTSSDTIPSEPLRPSPSCEERDWFHARIRRQVQACILSRLNPHWHCLFVAPRIRSWPRAAAARSDSGEEIVMLLDERLVA